MDWRSNLFVGLLLTDITGTIFFLIGEIFKRCIGNDVKLHRFLTKVTLGAFLVPFVYVILYMVRRVGTVKIESNINLFYNTPLVLKLGIILGCVWIGLFLLLLADRLFHRYRWTMVCRGNIPEEDEKIFRVFTDICAGFGIDGEVSLCRNDLVNVPCITYYHGYVVILPLVRYTEAEARVIFYHELCHYLNRDLYLKTVSCIAALLHVFNPLVHILLREADLICEKCCDMTACEKGINYFSGREYFQTITDLLVTDGKKDRYQLFALVDDRSNFERRVEFMVDYHKNGSLKKGAALVLSAAFLLGSSITSLAAGSGVTSAYEGLVEATSVKNDYEETVNGTTVDNIDNIDAADQEALEILSRAYDLNPDDVVMMGDDGIDLQGLLINITWTIPAGKTYMSTGFNQHDGDSVVITVASDPNDIDYQMGIKDPEAIMWYVEGSDVVYQEFAIVMDGRYYFFVTNLSETEKLHVEASIARKMANSNP